MFVPDRRVCGPSLAAQGGGTGHPAAACGPQSDDEAMIAIMLTTTWMLVTGRRLLCDRALLHDLSAPELIEFWAEDDQLFSGVDQS